MSNFDADRAYFEYLSGRSRLGLWYRRYYLYPRINRMLRGRVLDFGCGIGDFLGYRPDTAGAEINPHSVAHCVDNGHDARLIENDSIPWSDESFDGVVMDNVLEHIPSQRADAVIDEVLRVLKPGGTLLIGVPGRKGYAADPDHKCFYGESDLEQLMSAHGCRMRKLIHMPIGGAFADKHLTQYCIYAAFAKSMRGSPT